MKGDSMIRLLGDNGILGFNNWSYCVREISFVLDSRAIVSDEVS